MPKKNKRGTVPTKMAAFRRVVVRLAMGIGNGQHSHSSPAQYLNRQNSSIQWNCLEGLVKRSNTLQAACKLGDAQLACGYFSYSIGS